MERPFLRSVTARQVKTLPGKTLLASRPNEPEGDLRQRQSGTCSAINTETGLIFPGTALAAAELKLFQVCVCTSAENHFYPKYISECVMVPDFQTEYTSAKC